MDPRRFDRLTQALGAELGRRGLLGVIPVVGAALAGHFADPPSVAAAKRGRRHRKHDSKRHRKAGRDRHDGHDAARNAHAEGAPSGPDTTKESSPSCHLVVEQSDPRFDRFIPEGTGGRRINPTAIDPLFASTVEAFNNCAKQQDITAEDPADARLLYLYVIDSHRNKPKKAQFTNHLAGHALDVWPEIQDGNGRTLHRYEWTTITRCTNERGVAKKPGTQPRIPAGADCSQGWGDLSEPGAYPPQITAFFSCVVALIGNEDAWGGNHNSSGFDPIHIDDRLYSRDPAEWERRKRALRNSKPCPAGQVCDPDTLRCTPGCDPECPADRVCRNEECECKGGRADCDGVCTNTTGNDEHCGECGNDCTVVDEKCCGKQCVDTQTNLDHCGGCGEICAADGCCDGVCTDLERTDEHCGECGNDCTVEECQMCSERQCTSCADGATEGYECCKGRCRSTCADGKVRNPETCECTAPECIEDGDCGDPCRVCVEQKCRPKPCGECQECQGGACVTKPPEAGACTGSNGSCYTTPGRCGAAGGCYCRQAASGSGKCGNVCVGYLYTCRRTCAECPSGFRNCIKMGCCQQNNEQWVGCASSCANP